MPFVFLRLTGVVQRGKSRRVRPDQVVLLTICVEQHEFAALLMEECYKAGARKVNIDWTYDVQKRLNYLYAKKDVLISL